MRKSSLLLFVAMFAAAAAAQTDAQKAFGNLKNMSGTWIYKAPDGKSTDVNFRTVSGGSAVMSEILVPNEDMISMIHLDGPNRLLLTHYCAAGNQPRMAATFSQNGKLITFNFVDVTNLDTPDASHMTRVVFNLLDENHHTEEWTFVDHGKEMKEMFDLHRKM